jgi:hypothetical protein
LVAKGVKFTRFNVLVWLIASLGLSLILPGFVMRLESVPEPSPFLALNLCRTADGSFVGQHGRCPSDSQSGGNKAVVSDVESPSTQRIALHSGMLLSSIHYIPRIAVPKRLDLEGSLR